MWRFLIEISRRGSRWGGKEERFLEDGGGTGERDTKHERRDNAAVSFSPRMLVSRPKNGTNEQRRAREGKWIDIASFLALEDATKKSCQSSHRDEKAMVTLVPRC
eukprot:scaffold938_cov334-Pavlova_lutheri.AAC.68